MVFPARYKKKTSNPCAISLSTPTADFMWRLYIPRPQNSLYAKLTERLIDAIPPHITCSLDITLHQAAKHLSKDPSIAYLMVDYILHTAGYHVDGVRKVSGASDHCAMIAQVENRVR